MSSIFARSPTISVLRRPPLTLLLHAPAALSLLLLLRWSRDASCLPVTCLPVLTCSEEQRLEVLKQVCDKGQIVEVALNTHGTRAVQKLIETLTSREQRALVISALTPGVVSLIKDLNGNHVVQRCLQRLGPDDSQFVYDAARKHCMEIATHRHGCCVLQRCIDFATPTQKNDLVQEVARHALQLSQVREPKTHRGSVGPKRVHRDCACTPRPAWLRAAGQCVCSRPVWRLR